MALVQNSAEGGTNGTTVTTSNSGGTSGDAFGSVTITGTDAPVLTFSNSVAAHGSLSYRASGNSGDVVRAYLFNTASTTATTRVYMYINSIPTGNGVEVLDIQNSTFGFSSRVAVDTSGKIQVQDAGGTIIYTTPAALSAGQWYRLELQLIVGTGATNGTIAFQYYSGDSSSAISTYSSSTVNAGTNTIIRSLFGKQTPTAIFSANFDDFAFDTASATPIGPVGGGGSNQAPTANAGSDQSNVEAWSTVTLDGSGSTDADGTIASYAWTQTAGTSVTLSSSTAVKPTFTAPGGLANSTLTFSLTVTDNGGATSAADTVNIAVLAATERAVIGGVEVPVRTRVASGGTLV